MKIHLNEGGKGSGNFNHSGRPGEVGGSGNTFPASSDTSTRKKFAKEMADEYENNAEFKDMADGLAWYSQGFFDSYRLAMTSKNFDDYKKKEALLRGESPDVPDIKVGFSGLARVKDIFGKDIEPSTISASDVWRQTKAIEAYIKNSKESSVTIYRGAHEAQRDLQYAANEPDRYGNPIENNFPKKPKPNSSNFTKDAYRRDVQRYQHLERLRRLFTVGSINELSFLSFTYSSSTASKFAWGTGGRGVLKIADNERGYLIRIVGKHKGLNVAAFSPWNQQEVLVKGKFKTVAVHTRKTGIPDNLNAWYVVDLEQVE